MCSSDLAGDQIQPRRQGQLQLRGGPHVAQLQVVEHGRQANGWIVGGKAKVAELSKDQPSR